MILGDFKNIINDIVQIRRLRKEQGCQHGTEEEN